MCTSATYHPPHPPDLPKKRAVQHGCLSTAKPCVPRSRYHSSGSRVQILTQNLFTLLLFKMFEFVKLDHLWISQSLKHGKQQRRFLIGKPELARINSFFLIRREKISKNCIKYTEELKNQAVNYEDMDTTTGLKGNMYWFYID